MRPIKYVLWTPKPQKWLNNLAMLGLRLCKLHIKIEFPFFFEHHTMLAFWLCSSATICTSKFSVHHCRCALALLLSLKNIDWPIFWGPFQHAFPDKVFHQPPHPPKKWSLRTPESQSKFHQNNWHKIPLGRRIKKRKGTSFLISNVSHSTANHMMIYKQFSKVSFLFSVNPSNISWCIFHDYKTACTQDLAVHLSIPWFFLDSSHFDWWPAICHDSKYFLIWEWLWRHDAWVLPAG